MDNKERREALNNILKSSQEPVTGTYLARELGVSRQIIVSDIAILRAGGADVIATPQGYMMPSKGPSKLTATLACRHARSELKNELNIIVDNGGKVLDVVVEHPLYGEIKANLMVASRREVDEFISKLSQSGAEPLSIVTGGIHLHTIEVPDHRALEKIEQELKSKQILIR